MIRGKAQSGRIIAVAACAAMAILALTSRVHSRTAAHSESELAQPLRTASSFGRQGNAADPSYGSAGALQDLGPVVSRTRRIVNVLRDGTIVYTDWRRHRDGRDTDLWLAPPSDYARGSRGEELRSAARVYVASGWNGGAGWLCGYAAHPMRSGGARRIGFVRPPWGTIHEVGTLPRLPDSEIVALDGDLCAAGNGSNPQGERERAFRWSSFHLQFLGTLGGRNSFARCEALGGAIAGGAETAAGDVHAFLSWPGGDPRRDGRVIDLGTLGGHWSVARDMDYVESLPDVVTPGPPYPAYPRRLAVVGAAAVRGGAVHAFLYVSSPVHGFWRGGGLAERADYSGMTDLGTLPGDNSSNATAIVPGDGDILGTSARLSPPGRRACIWRYGRPIDLNEVVGSAGADVRGHWRLEEPVAMTPTGGIVGFGSRDGTRHAFLLQLPMPSARLVFTDPQRPLRPKSPSARS